MLKKLWEWLKNPHGWQVFVLWAVSLAAAAGAVALTVLSPDGAAAYAAYVFDAAAAILLGYSVYAAVKYAPHIRRDFLAYTERLPAANRFFRDYGFRTLAFGIFAFVINFGYAALQMVLAVLLPSTWYGVLAGYYFCLGALRCFLFVGWSRAKKHADGDARALADGKLRLYRLCGIALLVLEIALTTAVTQMVLSKSNPRSSEIMAISSAAYTFYRIALAVFNARKTYRLHDPLLQSFRNIGLTDAAVALLALETTMIATFGGETEPSLLIVRAATGFGVCALTIAMGIFMIVRGTQRLKKLRSEDITPDMGAADDVTGILAPPAAESGETRGTEETEDEQR